MKSVCIWLLVSIGLLIGLSSLALLHWLNDARQRGFFAWPEAVLLSALVVAYLGGAIAFMKHRRDRFF